MMPVPISRPPSETLGNKPASECCAGVLARGLCLEAGSSLVFLIQILSDGGQRPHATRRRRVPSSAISRPASSPTSRPSWPLPERCFTGDFEACIAHLRMPVTHRRAIRTTNLLERLFVEERRRLKIIANAFGEKPVLKLMFGAMIRAAERAL